MEKQTFYCEDTKIGIEVNIFLKQNNGTIPLKVEQSSTMIGQLLKEGLASYGFDSYQYEDIRIQKQSVSIFVTAKNGD